MAAEAALNSLVDDEAPAPAPAEVEVAAEAMPGREPLNRRGSRWEGRGGGGGDPAVRHDGGGASPYRDFLRRCLLLCLCLCLRLDPAMADAQGSRDRCRKGQVCSKGKTPGSVPLQRIRVCSSAEGQLLR